MSFAALDDFRPYEGEVFTTETAEGPVRVRLERVAALEDGPARSDGGSPFTLEFAQCEGAVSLPQATWWLAHPDGSELMVFLVPVGIEGGVMRYEAVFN